MTLSTLYRGQAIAASQGEAKSRLSQGFAIAAVKIQTATPSQVYAGDALIAASFTSISNVAFGAALAAVRIKRIGYAHFDLVPISFNTGPKRIIKE